MAEVPGPTRCPDCGGTLIGKGVRDRTVLDCRPVKVERIVYRLPRRRCRRCGRTVQAAAPGVLPKSRYGNGLLAHVAVQHYLYGVTLGQLEKQTGIGYGSLVDALHQLARRLKAIPERLILDSSPSPGQTRRRDDMADRRREWLRMAVLHAELEPLSVPQDAFGERGP